MHTSNFNRFVQWVCKDCLTQVEIFLLRFHSIKTVLNCVIRSGPQAGIYSPVANTSPWQRRVTWLEAIWKWHSSLELTVYNLIIVRVHYLYACPLRHTCKVMAGEFTSRTVVCWQWLAPSSSASGELYQQQSWLPLRPGPNPEFLSPSCGFFVIGWVSFAPHSVLCRFPTWAY